MKYAVVDYRISLEEIYNLENLGYKILKCPKSSEVYEAINGHPDIQMHVVDEKNIILQRNADNFFMESLASCGYNLIKSSHSLKDKYPRDIILNSYSTESFFIHNTLYTDQQLLCRVQDKIIINVKQGYTKCSILPVDNKAVITNDPSIERSLKKYDFDVLLLPYGDISLPGFNYGFIGGCGGKTSLGEMCFFGHLKYYKYKNEIINFLNRYNIKPIYLYNGPLIDRGSLFVI